MILNNQTEQILIGSLFGDGCLHVRKGRKTPIYCEDHSGLQKEYLLWKNKFFNFGFYEYNSSHYTDGKRVQLRSRAFPFFNFYYELFYKNGKKVITKEALNRLKPLGIAVWYCDDGYLDTLKGEIILGTYTTYRENLLIKQWLKNKFNICSKIRKRNKKFVIVLNSKNAKKFISLIKDHVPSCMAYKIRYDETFIKEKQRFANKLNYLKNRSKRLEYAKAYYWKNREVRLRANKEWREKNRERISKYLKLWREKNKDKIKEWRKMYWERNKEKWKLIQKRYYERNKDKILLRNRKWYTENREKVLARQKAYREKNREKIKLRARKYYLKNREKILAYSHEYYLKRRGGSIKGDMERKH